MLTQRMLQTGVSFQKLDELIQDNFLRKAEDLPSASQWQQLREKALHADLDRIRTFLKDRMEKARTRKAWAVRIGDKPLNQWILDAIIDGLSQSPDLRALTQKVHSLMGASIDLPNSVVQADLDLFKQMLIRETLLRLVDGVLLVKEHKLRVQESEEGQNRRMEVKMV